MIAELLTNLIVQLRRPRPIPLAIWFIDRPAMFYELLKARGPQGEYAVKYLCHRLTFYGIPIRVGVSERMKNYKNYFRCLPGVWIEMSDEKHLRLFDDLT